MESKWEKRKILIWGKTRPELSKKYREVVCTGGVFEDTKRLVRLYPIPLRYLDDERIFKKYQWIEAYVATAEQDPRPESYKIRSDGIRTLDQIPSKAGDWSDRAQWIMQPENIFQSVEALKAKWREDNTSLGLVKPKYVANIQAKRVPRTEKMEFSRRYEDALRQMELPIDPDTARIVKPLRPADYRYTIRFRCDDELCQKDHEFSVRDWELDALYFRLRQRANNPDVAAAKVVEKLHQVCGPDKDLYFYLGNISTHPHQFTIVGLWWPKKGPGAKQLELGLL
jgi:hypothetical protein